MIRLPRLSPATILAASALAVAVVGTAVAGPEPAKKPVNKSAAKKIAKKQIKRLAPGLHVASADTAADAAALNGVSANALQRRVPWALVDSDGSIIAQSGGVELTGHPSPGVYYLSFDVPTSGKAILVTNWYPGSDLDTTAMATACGASADAELCNANGDPGGDPNDGRHVFVEISQAASDVDHAFYVALVP